MSDEFLLSRYVHSVPLDAEASLLYSAATLALARVPRELADHLVSLPDRIVPEEIAAHERLGPLLKKNGFIVPANRDEVACVLAPLMNAHKPSRWLGVTIAPTMGCNFDCPYCFEDKSSARMMSAATAEKVVEFIGSRLEGKTNLSVTWYGGEPTLGIKRIEQITRSLDAALAGRTTAVFTEIITNGYCLDAEMRRRLAACGVSRYQITIDGPGLVHDRRRHLKNGGRTYDRIVENIRSLMGSAKIDIRVNVDTQNVARLDDLVDALEQEGLLTNCSVSFSHVDAITKASARYRDHCLSAGDFARAVGAAYERCAGRIPPLALPVQPHVCGALGEDSFVIDPEGRIYRCWTVLGDRRECLGNVHEASALSFDDSFSRFPLANEQACRSCDVLPICLGGCPYKFMQNRGEERCMKWKFDLHRAVRQFYCDRQTRREQHPNRAQLEEMEP